MCVCVFGVYTYSSMCVCVCVCVCVRERERPYFIPILQTAFESARRFLDGVQSGEVPL